MLARTSTAGWPRSFATVAIVAAALTAVMGVTATASIAATPAAVSARVHPGKYHSWKAAQRAAGFRLLRPGSTDGLIRTNGGIQVGRCASGYATVYAQYGRAKGRLLGLIQDDLKGAQPCSNIGEATTLGHPKVDGVTATLLGACGTMMGEPSCHSAHLWLFVVWARHGNYYQALSHDQSRRTIVAFARRLHKVS
jgi:hypothetical protein